MLDLTSFYAQFREETADNVRAIADGLLALEHTPNDRSILDAIFRAAHTIKGSSRLLGFAQVGSVGHALESLLDALRSGRISLNPGLNDLLLAANDALLTLAQAAADNQPAPFDPQSLIQRLEAALPDAVVASTNVAAPTVAVVATPPARVTPSAPVEPVADRVAAPTSAVPPAVVAAPPTPPAQPLTPAPARSTVRVRVDRLERLLAIAGELSVSRQETMLHLDTLQSLQHEIAELHSSVARVEAELRRSRMPVRPVLQRELNSLTDTTNGLASSLRNEIENYTRRTTTSGLLIDELEAEVFAARLVPVATVFAPLPRAVRELARTLNKQVELIISGEQTEADRKVLDGLADPLLHLVRNALDHGLETAAERMAVGKDPTGHIRLQASTDGSQIHIAVSDDGRGMDPQALRAAAVRKGLIDAPTAHFLSDLEALELIFMPGFSTSALITDISGRGVGMDVVASRVAELNGTARIDSAIGTGTTITLVLPVSLMTSQVVLVEVAGQVWALPSTGCAGLERIDPTQLHTVENQPVITLEGRTALVVKLADLLDLPTSEVVPRHQHALVLGTARPLIVLVDRLVDEREVVIKPLGTVFRDQGLVVGAAPLADGSLALVLSPQALLERTRRVRRAPAMVQRTIPRLLVADDSFTTRELLRSILQSAGYAVTTAIDGQDALEKVRAGTFDLVVSDVEMPRLDGFGLTRSLRSDETSVNLPVILVTSLHSDEHKRAGALAGAQAYIVKSEFSQGNLLEIIRQLAG